MIWGLYLLILAGCFALAISFYLYWETGRFKFLGFLGASFLFIITDICLILQHFIHAPAALYWVSQWGSICCIAFVLCSLLLDLRQANPGYLQFSRLYSAVPILIIIPFLLVRHSGILQMWLLSIYEAGTVLAGLVLYGRYIYQQSIYRTAFAGVVLLSASFSVYLLLPASYIPIYQICMAAGIATFFSGYLIVNSHSRTLKKKRSY